jgi:hypothetical protein
MEENLRTDTRHPVLRDWLESRELGITFLFALLTSFGGWALEKSLIPFAIAAVELLFGTIFWAAKKISAEVGELREALSNHHSIMHCFSQLGDADISKDISRITESLVRLTSNSMLKKILKHELKITANRFTAIADGTSIPTFARVPGEVLQDTFQTYMQFLPRGFRYDTLSSLLFWSQSTMGNPEELLNVNVLVAGRSNGRIRRVFLIDKPLEEFTSDERDILARHRDSTLKEKRIDARVHRLKTEAEVERWGNFAICESPGEKAIVLGLHYTPSDKRFERMDIVREEKEVARLQDLFKYAYDQAISVDAFLSQK